MKKKIIFIAAVLLFLPAIAFGAGNSVSVDYYQTSMPDYFYPRTFDNLVLDFKINPSGGDTLKTLVVKNEGLARNLYEIEKVVLWADAGGIGFSGFAVDDRLAEAVYDSTNNFWVFDNLNYAIDAGGREFFVTVESWYNGTVNKGLKFSIPAYFDNNSNGQYDRGDTGVYLQSGLTFPLSTFINEDQSAYRASTVDSFAPVSVIENLSEGEVINTDSFTIIGHSKDQGGSFPDIVNVCIDNVCNLAQNTGSYYDSWSYEWNNISEGEHIIYVRATDFNNNSASTGTTAVEFVKPVVEPEPEPEPTPEEPVVEAIDYTIGRWVKLADATAVYFLDNKNTRHAYPTQSVWESYFGKDFSTVETIGATEMAGYALGNNVPFKPGILMKIPSVPKVYKIEANGVIRWITTENLAKELFGISWASLVKDLPESFFTDYTVGADIE